MGYVHGAQTDLRITLKVPTDTSEDLSTYTAVMHFRKDTLPLSSETTVTATITVITSILTYVSYTLSAASSIAPAGSYNLIIDGQLTSAAALWRRTSPAIVHINKYGDTNYTQT
jgi:hypothetical protein